jgi:hypothetical protein
MQIVKITMEGGVIHDMEIPEGVTVIVRDYDSEGCEPDRINQDENGDDYVESTWEASE